jgi:hypothetical protein
MPLPLLPLRWRRTLRDTASATGILAVASETATLLRSGSAVRRPRLISTTHATHRVGGNGCASRCSYSRQQYNWRGMSFCSLLTKVWRRQAEAMPRRTYHVTCAVVVTILAA